ncbi:hypothetical protein B0T18DRAFT_432398 [Schizothecium vesticola]|uniref:NAD(P)-binding protein n=1 Tax=Schizothecium vesticola TaxID=314040 RepID=A0AA40K0A1_9PEZI|nr:hypothetical protein B0T18DRAFT_432398 [Schizothecium vesticola]
MDIANLFSVKEKVVLITGGAKGLGLMISTGFVLAGAKVYISSRDAAACTAACASLNALPPSPTTPLGTAIPLPADLSLLPSVHRLAATLTSLEPAGLHILINNSGATWGEPFDTYPDAAWTKLLTINLQRVFSLTQALTPLMEKAAAASRTEGGVVADPSRVIHIGSIDGLRVPGMATFAYSASKAGLHQLSRHLATELGPRGITSNVLACGPFPSKMMAATLRDHGEAIVRGNPMGRVGRAEDVAGACIWLGSRAGAWVNGATVRVDGGASLVGVEMGGRGEAKL